MALTARPDPSYFPPLVTAAGIHLPFAQIVDVDPENLPAELETHAAWQATIAFAHAAARTRADAFERQVKRKEASISFTIRANLERQLKIKPTVDAIERALRCDEDLAKMEDELGELRRVERELEVARQAMIARRDMLVNLSSTQRAEMRQT